MMNFKNLGYIFQDAQTMSQFGVVHTHRSVTTYLLQIFVWSERV